MKDLNRYVINKFAIDWKDVGLELGLNLSVLHMVKVDHLNQSRMCLQAILEKWLRLTPDATWRALEIALTNVTRQKLDLDPVDDVYGENFACSMCSKSEVTYNSLTKKKTVFEKYHTEVNALGKSLKYNNLYHLTEKKTKQLDKPR